VIEDRFKTPYSRSGGAIGLLRFVQDVDQGAADAYQASIERSGEMRRIGQTLGASARHRRSVCDTRLPATPCEHPPSPGRPRPRSNRQPRAARLHCSTTSTPPGRPAGRSDGRAQCRSRRRKPRTRVRSPTKLSSPRLLIGRKGRSKKSTGAFSSTVMLCRNGTRSLRPVIRPPSSAVFANPSTRINDPGVACRFTGESRRAKNSPIAVAT